MILTTGGQKGGPGKSTTAVNLAAWRARLGRRPLLVDADPQGSATRWCQRRAGMASAVLPLDGTRKSWRRTLPDDTQRVIVDAAAGAACPLAASTRATHSAGTNSLTRWPTTSSGARPSSASMAGLASRKRPCRSSRQMPPGACA